jgi:DNA-binding HxlR family transcriptional regulator
MDNTANDRFCSVARSLEILSDAWSFLVLRELFFGARRFEHFQSALRVPRNTLVQRLTKLTGLGLIKRVPAGAKSVRLEYRFTHKGIELYPTMLALLAFGDRWLLREEIAPLQLRHKVCGQAFSPKVVCDHCHEEVAIDEAQYRDGPGAGSVAREPRTTRSRRASDPQVFERVRPCSVARTLQIIGDRWSILLLREMMLGVRRFDEFQHNLGIAPNILSDRLRRMQDSGVASRVAYQERPPRHEYRFTAKGRDLYSTVLVVMRWGDKWLSEGRAPLLLRHTRCQHDFSVQVVCSACGEEVGPHDVEYRLRYRLQDMDMNGRDNEANVTGREPDAGLAPGEDSSLCA